MLGLHTWNLFHIGSRGRGAEIRVLGIYQNLPADVAIKIYLKLCLITICEIIILLQIPASISLENPAYVM